MKIENDFEVPATPARTFDLLVDLDRVGSCIPGGKVGPESEDGSHPAEVAVKVGPMRMNYAGKVRIEERDEENRRAVLSTEVREKRGQGTAKATMTMTVEAAGEGSLVKTGTDVILTGKAAQMGRGMVDDVAARIVDEMAQCVAAKLTVASGGENESPGSRDRSAGSSRESQVAAKPIGGIRLILKLIWTRIKRLFRGISKSSNKRGGDRDA